MGQVLVKKGDLRRPFQAQSKPIVTTSTGRPIDPDKLTRTALRRALRQAAKTQPIVRMV